jgi:hypothetical protein
MSVWRERERESNYVCGEIERENRIMCVERETERGKE